jgi:LacI family transcriptional regulator, gluconate utilization system Gnt-I transcriptional repressor
MGFNDQEIASAVVPAITSVSTPRREIGLTAARMLVDELRGKSVMDRCVNTGFRIIERRSKSETLRLPNSEPGTPNSEPRTFKGVAACELMRLAQMIASPA